MPIDPNIALSVKPIQLEDPMNMMGRFAQLQQAQSANALNSLKLQQDQQAAERQNALLGKIQGRKLDAPEVEQAYINAGMGEAYGKIREQKLKADVEASNLLDKNLARFRSFAPQVQNEIGVKNYIDSMYKDPVLGEMAASMKPYDQAMQENLALFKSDPLRWQAVHANLTGEQIINTLKQTQENQDLGGTIQTKTKDFFGRTIGAPVSTPKTATPGELLTQATAIRGQNLTDARARELNNLTREANQTQIINDPIRGPILVNKGTGVYRSAVSPEGQPLQGEIPAKKEASAKSLISVLDEADNLVDKATGSYLGAGIDLGGRVFGGATAGDKASAKLKVLEGALMLNQPRMEGPQSNQDVMLYRQMAGQIGDSTVPASIKKEALATIRTLTEKYAGMSNTKPGEKAGSAAPAKSKSGATVSNW